MNWTNSTTLLGTTYTYTYKAGANVSVWTTAATTKTWEQLLETNTFTAVWAPKYSLRYDANGGSTTPPSVEGNFEVDRKTGDVTQPSVTKTAADAITRDGYTFKGWKDQASGEEFTPGDAVELTTANPNRVLVAQWKQNTVPTPTPHDSDAFGNHSGTRSVGNHSGTCAFDLYSPGCTDCSGNAFRSSASGSGRSQPAL